MSKEQVKTKFLGKKVAQPPSWAYFLCWSIVIPPLVILVNTFEEIATMNKWNNLLAVLDRALGFLNKQSSKVMKRGQGFDNKTQEHVIWLEYRVRVDDEAPPPIPDEQKAREARNMAYLRRVATDLATARSSKQK